MNNPDIHQTKLPVATQVEIMRRYYNGEVTANLARRYGVSKTYITDRTGNSERGKTVAAVVEAVDAYERKYGPRPLKRKK